MKSYNPTNLNKNHNHNILKRYLDKQNRFEAIPLTDKLIGLLTTPQLFLLGPFIRIIFMPAIVSYTDESTAHALEYESLKNCLVWKRSFVHI